MAPVASIEGIGPKHTEDLAMANVKSVTELLEEGGTRAGRKHLAKAAGVTEHLILEWVNRADLMRVKGVGKQYSDLLEKCGVESVKELAHRNADHLFAKTTEVAESSGTRIVRRPPSHKEVSAWVTHAKRLPRKVEY
eukprot:CAMPEP_0114621628 /NCGR_PEP_ID=MMETSP0168-20121206/9324_1 /TAXON_ID=95228 ORGANISM="Vannella sp., Strain DIVA3 517/6/12" /NCGR_SAMPLE_ID=MMETSP0168 /ASSEMBLY_ACC=CAM_ASM_000044 /LENGTH=136 /DNA_ID=CAMNT_0001832827 /DNA_START=62 /DNA_END=472 /DNA_ORIENTATION=+